MYRMEAENYFEETRLCVNLEYKYCREFCIVNSTTRPSSDSVVSSPKPSTSSLPPHYYCPDTLVYKMQPTTLLFTLLLTPLVSAKCDFQSVGILSKKWRLSTYKSQNCINKVQDVTKSGFGTWCIDIPNTTRPSYPWARSGTACSRSSAPPPTEYRHSVAARCPASERRPRMPSRSRL